MPDWSALGQGVIDDIDKRIGIRQCPGSVKLGNVSGSLSLPKSSACVPTHELKSTKHSHFVLLSTTISLLVAAVGCKRLPTCDEIVAHMIVLMPPGVVDTPVLG